MHSDWIMLKVENLRKTFGDLVAVDEVSFEAEPGRVYGLLGPNGAGKTTTISMLCGLLRPDRGKAWVGGIDVWSQPVEAKRLLGFVPQEIVLYGNLSGMQNLKFWGGLYGLSGSRLKRRAEEILELVGLQDRARDRISTYSGGMKRRLNLGAGLMHSPKILLLDEPTVGIDPQAREHLLGVVKQLAEDGATVVYTSHYLDEVERLCDEITIIDEGKVLAAGTLHELRKLVGHGRVVILHGRMDAGLLDQALEDLGGAKRVTSDDHQAMIAVEPHLSAPALMSRLYEHKIDVSEMSIREPDLHGVFLALTGRELRD